MARLHDVSPVYAWRPQISEVAVVLDIPVDELASPAVAGTQRDVVPQLASRRVVPVRYLRGQVVWGLTLRILDCVMPEPSRATGQSDMSMAGQADRFGAGLTSLGC